MVVVRKGNPERYARCTLLILEKTHPYSILTHAFNVLPAGGGAEIVTKRTHYTLGYFGVIQFTAPQPPALSISFQGRYAEENFKEAVLRLTEHCDGQSLTASGDCLARFAGAEFEDDFSTPSLAAMTTKYEQIKSVHELAAQTHDANELRKILSLLDGWGIKRREDDEELL